MPKKHARYSPSALDSLSQCVRFKYWNKYEDKADDGAGGEGTMLHDCFEHEVITGLDEEQATCVMKCVDYKNSFLAADGGPEMFDIYAERKWTLEDRTYGYADFVAIHKVKPLIHVMDAKFVRRDDEHDFQVKTYGAAAVEEFFPDRDDAVVVTHVVAPRIHLIDKHEYDAQTLYKEVCADIDALYQRIEDPFNPPTPNEELCEKCARASRCPAVGNAIVEVAKGLGLPMPEQFEPDAIVSERDRAIAHILAGAMDAWAKQVKKNNNAYAAEGNEVPGFSLRSRSNGLKASSDITPVVVTSLKAAGFAEDDILEACTFSVAKLSKAQAAMSDKTVAEIKEEIRSSIGDYLTESSSTYLQKSKRISDTEALKQIINPPALTEGDK